MYAAQLTILPDGRLMLGTQELSRRESDAIRSNLQYADGSLPAHVGVQDLPNGQKQIWRIEDGVTAATTWIPEQEQAMTDAEKHRVDLLIEREIEPDPDDPRPEQARLKERHIHVWAIAGSLTPDGRNRAAVADAYDLSSDAVLAAQWYYLRHRDRFDARLRTNDFQ
ncbi:MAG: hypothetical protein ACYDAR_02225 [Thermomicrobiales bacterium]